MPEPTKPMRELMPQVTKWIDDLRATFGAEGMDKAIRQGLRDGTFAAIEGEHTVGNPSRDLLIIAGRLPPDPELPPKKRPNNRTR